MLNLTKSHSLTFIILQLHTPVSYCIWGRWFLSFLLSTIVLNAYNLRIRPRKITGYLDSNFARSKNFLWAQKRCRSRSDRIPCFLMEKNWFRVMQTSRTSPSFIRDARTSDIYSWKFKFEHLVSMDRFALQHVNAARMSEITFVIRESDDGSTRWHLKREVVSLWYSVSCLSCAGLRVRMCLMFWPAVISSSIIV